MRKILLLGGGPTNLALAQGLVEAELSPESFSCILIERQPVLGGHARTDYWPGNGFHDLGPHKIFSVDKRHMNRVLSLLSPEMWLLRPKKCSIFLEGKFLPYPPSPLSLIEIYGRRKFTRMVLDFFLAKIRALKSSRPAVNFAEELQQRVGKTLYKTLFEPLAKKLWDDPEVLDPKVSKGRIQTPDLKEIFLRMIGFKKGSQFEALDFYYPKGGLQKIWDKIESRFQRFGEIKKGIEVSALEVLGNSVKALVLRDVATGSESRIDVDPHDVIFSSLPLNRLPQLLKEGLPEPIQIAMREYICFNGLVLVFLKVRAENFLKESWVFIPDPTIPFHRISEQESFDPSMTPGGSIVCCEIKDCKSRPMFQYSDQQLIGMVMEGLKKMGYTCEIADQKVVRLPNSYPMYRIGSETALQSILKYFDQFSNFKTIGRGGAFNYIGTLDCMDIGFGAARWFCEHRGGDTFSRWQAERQRTAFYPVLD